MIKLGNSIENRVRGKSAAHYEYAPFGALTKSTGPVSQRNPWRFSSEYADDVTGTVYYNYRHYEPTMGRWLSRDPIEEQGGVNLMAFCGNGSIGCVDILGNDFLGSIAGFADTRVGKFLSCMGDCVSANDPIEKAINKFLAYAAAGAYPKSLVANLFEMTGNPKYIELASKIRASARSGAIITNLESIIALYLDGPAIKVALRRLGDGLTRANTMYGLYMLQVEAACAGACCGGDNYDNSIGLSLPFNAIVQALVEGFADAL